MNTTDTRQLDESGADDGFCGIWHFAFRTESGGRGLLTKLRHDVHMLHRDQSGMMTMANVVCVLLSVLLFTATLNNSHVANRSVERQSAADAIASTAGVWIARGMNSITATNHLMGEMLSMVILHEALGGKKQENGVSADDGPNKSKEAERPRKLKRRDAELKLWYQAALAASRSGLIRAPDENIFELVYQRSGGSSDILAEATLLDSKMKLKEWLIRTYQGMVLAAALKAIPYTRAAGEALEVVMQLLELKIQQEYLTLKAIHGIADQLLPVKLLLRDSMLPYAKSYTTDVVRTTPLMARAAAERIGAMNNVRADVFPYLGGLQMPVQIDPLALSHQLPVTDLSVPEPDPLGCGCPSVRSAVSWDQVSKMTQLARATFPWVNYHRKPVLDAMSATLHLADTKEFYFHWTNGYSKFIVQEQQEPNGSDPDSHLGLYVLKGYDGPDKGYELWNLAEHSQLTDEYFTLLGLAWQKRPSVIGSPVFRQQHPDGMLSYAMVLLYNGNEQQRPQYRIDPTCKRIVPIRQANTGMDTLNYLSGSLQDQEGCGAATGEPPTSRAGENRPFELLGIGIPAEYPQIKVNWQSKLIPATGFQLARLKRSSGGHPFGNVIRRMLDTVPRSLNTH